MHKLGITRNVVAIVSDAAGGRRVRCVTLEIGQHAGVVSDANAFCFDVVMKGTALEGAGLEIPSIEACAGCSDCGAAFAIPALAPARGCGSRNLVRLAGEELNVKSMELEEAA